MPSASQRSAIELAIAAALEKAAVAAAGGLHIRSCKLSGASLDITAVLQALPASSLTSLDLSLHLNQVAADSDIHALMGRLSTALPSLHQLQKLHLLDDSFYDHYIAVGPVLSGFGALTNLECLVLSQVTGMQRLSCSRGGRGVVELRHCLQKLCCRATLPAACLMSPVTLPMHLRITVVCSCLADSDYVRLHAACIWKYTSLLT
jgi:hypothetical protein